MTRSRAAASLADDLYEDHDAAPMPSPGKRTLTDRLVRGAGPEEGESFFQAGPGPIDAPALFELIAHELPKPERMRVTADGLYIRRTPAKERDNIVGGYHRGDLVDTVGRSGEWLLRTLRPPPGHP